MSHDSQQTPRRVLMVSDVYFPRINGVSTSMATFRRGMAEEGIDVRLVVPRYGDEADEPGIIRIAGRPVPGDPEDRMLGWRAMHKTVLEAAADCDLIHIQTPFVAHYAGLKAARTLGLPVASTYHTLFEEYLHHYASLLPSSWLKKQARGFSRRQCNAVDSIIVPSSAMRDRLLSYGVTQPLHILPTGIPLGQFRNGNGRSFRYRNGILSYQPVALFVGRVAHEKNIAFLLEAIRQARLSRPDLLLLIAGEGPASGELRQRVQQLGLSEGVMFLGYLDRNRDLPDCYAAADAFVFASRTETQGLVLLEAMAAGLPVVGLPAMGTIDILAPGRGCITPPDDPIAFGDALADLLNHPAQCTTLASEAVAYAAEWSDTAMAGRLAGLYQQILTHHREHPWKAPTKARPASPASGTPCITPSPD